MDNRRTPSLAAFFHIVIMLLALGLFACVYRLPLVSTLGIEAANVFVLALGPLLFCAAVFNKKSVSSGFHSLFMRELIWLGIHFFTVVILLSINGLFKQSCSEGAGFLPFLILSAPPLLLNVTAGVLAAVFTRTKWQKLLVIIACLVLYVAWVSWSWVQEPNFRLFTHASILLSSDLLKGDALSAAAVGFRASTLLLAFALIWFGENFLGARSPAIFHRAKQRSFFRVAGLVVLVCTSYLLANNSMAALGKNRAQLEQDYRLLAERDGLRIFANPEKTSTREAEAMLGEARYYQAKLGERLGGVSHAPITIWLHHTGDDKFLYTGARNVHFALPALREIHIAGTEIPHESLGHELAHIYVGEHTSSWFGIPSTWRVIPNLALTEGLATALSEELRIDNGLTIIEQAQAMHQADIRINVSDLFSENPLYFAKADPSAAYLYSAAALLFLFESRDQSLVPGQLRTLIEHGSLDALFANEADRKKFEAAFLAKLNEASSPQAILWAKMEFPKTSILGADCRAQEEQKAWLTKAIINLDAETIASRTDALPKSQRSALLISAGESLKRNKGYSGALKLFSEAQPLLTDVGEEAQLKLKIVDALTNLRDVENSEAVLASISPNYFFAPQQRLLIILNALVKTQYSELKNISRACMEFLFAHPDDMNIKVAELAYQRGLLAHNELLVATTEAMFATYVLARFHSHSGAHEEASKLFSVVLQQRAQLPPSIVREASITRAADLVKLGQNHAALYLFQDLLEGATSNGERLFLQDKIDRLRFLLKR